MVPSLATHAGRAGTDRCPGTLTVHQARDGGLARIRVPGGMMPGHVLGLLGDWSGELGNGRVELTARGNLQLRGLAPGSGDVLFGRLAAHGLLPSPAHDRARNVLASPLSGRDGRGVLDVRPLVAELDRRLCASPELAELPGRFLFALDDGRGDVAGLGADAAALGMPGGRVALLLAGRDTRLRPSATAAVAALLAAAAAFLCRRPDQRTWRVAELPDGPLSLVGELAGLDSGPEVAAPRPSPLGPVGVVAQTDGRVALAVGVPLGELTPARCRLLAELAEREVVLTPWRAVVLPDLAPRTASAAACRLADVGLMLDPAAPLLGVSACIGRPGCASALADVRADAMGGDTGVGPPVHWSGCERRCGRPAGTAVDVVAAEDGYRVLHEGRVVCHGAAAAEARTAATAARYGR